jgi:hypothetical protein
MKKNIFLVFSLVFILGCNNLSKDEMASADAAVNSSDKAIKAISESEPAGNSISSTAAQEKNTDPNRKFIRKADIKCRVKNVITSTYNIEDIIAKQGGFVTLTNLKTQIDETSEITLSSDSNLINTKYTIVNHMTLRVPNIKLDTTLKEIAKNIDFLDFRTITAEDVALQLLQNNMTQSRIEKNEKRLINAIDSRGKKLEETTSAEELIINKKEQADNTKIENLSLHDQINFSTISLELYQRSAIKHEVVASEKNIQSYEPNLFLKLWESIKDGWRWIENIIVFFVRFWAIVLIGLGTIMLYRKYGHLLKNKL